MRCPICRSLGQVVSVGFEGKTYKGVDLGKEIEMPESIFDKYTDLQECKDFFDRKGIIYVDNEKLMKSTNNDKLITSKYSLALIGKQLCFDAEGKYLGTIKENK